MEWDVFISHAWEDKESFARPLAEELRRRGVTVWFDEFTLRIGDSLRRSIDRGLANSRYGIVILSPNFFAKEWPQKELDGLAAREVDGTKVILPIWHNITAEQVRLYSPMLAGKLAAKSNSGLERVATELMFAMDLKIDNKSAIAEPITNTRKLNIFKLTRNQLLFIFAALIVMTIAVTFLNRDGIVSAISSNPSPTNAIGALAIPTRVSTPTVSLVVLTSTQAPPILLSSTNTPTFLSTAIRTETPKPTSTTTITPTPMRTPTLTATGVMSPTPSGPEGMILIPSGVFYMGAADSDITASADEKPGMTLDAPAYWIDKYEVSVGQYKKCVDAGKCDKPSSIWSAQNPNALFGNPNLAAVEQYPITFITQGNASQYCVWLGKRLPYEYEWEKAARGPFDERKWPWGNTWDGYKTNAAQGNAGSVIVTIYSNPVDLQSYGCSPFGVCNMAGNVREWVADFYQSDWYKNGYRDVPTGTVGKAKPNWNGAPQNVIRGSSWKSTIPDSRISKRWSARPNDTIDDVGVRCAMDSK